MYSRPTPKNPGVCAPPPTEPANVVNFIPQGVIPENPRFTTIKPFTSGKTAKIHSKHPQLVVGVSIIEYKLNFSTALLDLLKIYSLTPSHSPLCALRHFPIGTGSLPPVGFISDAAFPSSQLYAPHKPNLS